MKRTALPQRPPQNQIQGSVPVGVADGIPREPGAAAANDKRGGNKKKKTWILLLILLLILGLGAGAYFLLFRGKKSIDLNQYLNLEVREQGGHYSVDMFFDYASLILDNKSCFAMNNEKREEARQYIEKALNEKLDDATLEYCMSTYNLTEDEALAFLILSINITGEIDCQYNLSDGDEVRFSWDTIDTEAVEKILGIQLKYSDVVYTVGDPMESRPLDISPSQGVSGQDANNPAEQDMRPKVWARNEDKAIDQLVEKYFRARTEADAAAMEKVLTEDTPLDSIQLTMESKAYESYDDVRIYSYPGMKKSETGLFLTYNSKFRNIDTKLPTIAWFYVKQDEEGNLRLMPLTDDSSAEYEYMYSTYAGSPVEKLANEVAAANKAAIDGDPNLKMYLAQLANHNYEAFVPETTKVSSTTTPNLTTVPPAQSADTQPSTTAEPNTAAQHGEEPILPAAVPLISLDIDDIKVGTVVTYGTYEQDNNLQNGKEDIEWIVYWISTSNIYIISRYVLDALPFAAENKATIYENSYLDLWLEKGNNSFMNIAFSNAERNNLAWMELDPPENGQYPKTQQTGLLYRKVANFSLNEVVEYLPEEYWQACGTPYAFSRGLQETGGFSPWWLRTMGQGSIYATFMTAVGEFDYAGAPVTNNSLGVRPVISLKTDLFRGSSAGNDMGKQESEVPIAQDPEEIVRQLYALNHGGFLPGSYTLSGYVVEIVTPYNSQENYITVKLLVTDREHLVTAYKLQGGADIVMGDYITVSGRLTRYNEWYEFVEGCSYQK